MLSDDYHNHFGLLLFRAIDYQSKSSKQETISYPNFTPTPMTSLFPLPLADATPSDFLTPQFESGQPESTLNFTTHSKRHSKRPMTETELSRRRILKKRGYQKCRKRVSDQLSTLKSLLCVSDKTSVEDCLERAINTLHSSQAEVAELERMLRLPTASNMSSAPVPFQSNSRKPATVSPLATTDSWFHQLSVPWVLVEAASCKIIAANQSFLQALFHWPSPQQAHTPVTFPSLPLILTKQALDRLLHVCVLACHPQADCPAQGVLPGYSDCDFSGCTLPLLASVRWWMSGSATRPSLRLINLIWDQ